MRGNENVFTAQRTYTGIHAARRLTAYVMFVLLCLLIIRNAMVAAWCTMCMYTYEIPGLFGIHIIPKHQHIAQLSHAHIESETMVFLRSPALLRLTRPGICVCMYTVVWMCIYVSVRLGTH